MRQAGNRDGWWFRASTEQKLAQIDAAIELGMTAKQVAMNCGCLLDVGKDGLLVEERNRGHTVARFALNHGRNFNGISVGTFSGVSAIKTDREKQEIDRTHTITDYAYDIFGVKDHSDSLFDDYGMEA